MAISRRPDTKYLGEPNVPLFRHSDPERDVALLVKDGRENDDTQNILLLTRGPVSMYPLYRAGTCPGHNR